MTSLEEAKEKLKDQYKRNMSVVGVGIGADRLHLYVLDSKTADTMPRCYNGYPVDVVITGAFKVQTHGM